MANETKPTVNELIRLYLAARGISFPASEGGQTSLDILQSNGTNFVKRQPVAAEINKTLNGSGANDTAIGANTARFVFDTLPTTSPLYKFTGVTVNNGATVNGNISIVIVSADAIPPVSTFITTLAWGSAAQTGASSTQRIGPTGFSSQLIEGGTVYGVALITGSASGTYLTATVASANNSKSITQATDIFNGNGASWAATTESPNIIVHYKPVLGV